MHDIFTSILLHSITIFDFGGGGGSGGGGGGGFSGGGGGYSSGSYGSGESTGTGHPIIVFITLAIFIAIFIYIARVGSRNAKKRKALITKELSDAAASDQKWNEGKLLMYTKDIFIHHQEDWTNFNIENMSKYMTPHYLYHTQLMLAALQQMKRQNQVNNLLINNAAIIAVDDETDNTKDAFDVQITATADDVIYDTAAKNVIYIKRYAITQTYHYLRSKDTWLIAGLSEATENALMVDGSLAQFAQQNNLCYSADWGWLLLPQRGQLFGRGRFGTSDINNHVIGMYNDILIQLYSYSPTPADKVNYMIAQATLPKSYGDIVVRRKKTLAKFGIRGLKRVSTEWGDFNKKYDVFATSIEQATSLELLNPKFMEQLEALSIEINIEVVDNVVYLYSPILVPQNAASYTIMLDVLKAAFKEMRM